MILQANPTPTIQQSIEFITPEALLTTGTAILAVIVVSNTVSHVSGWQSRWFSLILSLIVSFAVYEIGTDGEQKFSAITLLLILINGCLIYTSAFGLQNNVIAGVIPTDPTVGTTPPAGPLDKPRKVTFFSKW